VLIWGRFSFMTPRRLQAGLALYAVLSGAVLFNMVYLQGVGRVPRVELGRAPDAGRPAPVGTQPAPATSQTDADTIRAIQRELDGRGYGIGRPDGLPSLVTRAAILAYELDHGLPLLADPSEDLLRVIVLGSAEANATPATPRGKTGPHADQVIRTVQQSLQVLGFGPAQTDGQLGEATVTAISRFEREQGLPPTGRISAPMVARLARLAAASPARSVR
jgi:peptidoglycan hydrolase-like protein with peptidoglycan-binding domain